MRKVTGREVGKQVCEALRIDIHQVRCITIRMPANDGVTVTVERFISLSDVQGVMPELVNETYELVQRDTSTVETQ